MFIRILTIVVCVALAAARAHAEESVARWTMLNVSPKEEQADCHLVTFPDGQQILIDAADAGDAPGVAVKEFSALGVKHLSFILISHFHRDHYGRLLDILDTGVAVDRVIVNVPVQRVADRELPWGCNFIHVQSVLAELRNRGIPYETPKAGDRLLEVTAPDGTKGGVDVLCAFDGVNTPIGETDVNDTSIIARVFFGANRILFTGDLNHSLGAYLATSEIDITANLLKVPHHGTEGVAPNEFFDRVGAKVVFVPSPKNLWFSKRSERIHTYFAGREIPAYVSGIHGNITVTLTPRDFSVETERKAPDPVEAEAPL